MLYPIADPRTGEVIAEEGEVISRQKAKEIAAAGVSVAFVLTDSGKEVKVISNGMVNLADFVSFDPKEECGVDEQVRFSILCDILDSCEDEETLKQAIRDRIDELVPKHIIIDDIFASINYGT